MQVDHSIIESFGQGGRTVVSSRVYPTEAIYGAARLFLFNNATGINIKVSLTVWQLNSAFIRPFPFDQSQWKLMYKKKAKILSQQSCIKLMYVLAWCKYLNIWNYFISLKQNSLSIIVFHWTHDCTVGIGEFSPISTVHVCFTSRRSSCFC